MAKTNSFFLVGVLCGVSFMGACARVSSTNVATSDICMTATITGGGGSASCSVTLTVGCGIGATQIELASTDALTCTVSGSSSVLTASGTAALGTLAYVSGTMTYSTSSTYTVGFSRANGAETYAATGTLPTAPAVLTPSAGFSVAKSAGLTTTWTAGTGSSIPVRIQLGSSIVSDSSSDDGTHSFSASTLTSMSGTGAATLRVTRRVSGTMPSGLQGNMYMDNYTEVAGTLN